MLIPLVPGRISETVMMNLRLGFSIGTYQPDVPAGITEQECYVRLTPSSEALASARGIVAERGTRTNASGHGS